jgi:hypothetical protein
MGYPAKHLWKPKMNADLEYFKPESVNLNSKLIRIHPSRKLKSTHAPKAARERPKKFWLPSGMRCESLSFSEQEISLKSTQAPEKPMSQSISKC